jgi:hypothetical protein
VGDKRGKDQQTTPFEVRPGVGPIPALGGMTRAVDPAGIPPHKFHLLENVRRNFGGIIERGGQEKLFPDRLHDENTGEGGPGTGWDDDSGIGKITGIDPGADESRYGAPLLYCGQGTDVSTWDGVTQREMSSAITFGAGLNVLPIPTVDAANNFLFGYRTVYAVDGVTPLYYITGIMSLVGGTFGVSTLASTPALTSFGGSVPNAGIPQRICWSVPEKRYYQITDNGLVLSYSEAGGDVIEEDDNSLDTASTDTVYGVPVIFENDDNVVLLVGYGVGIGEPTTMANPLCYVKDTNAGTWTQDTSLAANFVPTTRPVAYNQNVFVGGYTQPTDSTDVKTAAVYVWQTGSGWAAVSSFATAVGSFVQGLAPLGAYLYALYNDPVNVNNGIIDRFYGPTDGVTQNHKVFFSQFPAVSLTDSQDGLVAFRGELYTRIYQGGVPYDAEGHLWKTVFGDVSGTWVLTGPDGINVSGDPLNQVLNGKPEFVV